MTRRAPRQGWAGAASAGAAPVAIVGAACRLPGAPDLDAYWRLLEAGVDAVSTLPADRFAQGPFFHPRRGEPGRSYSFAAGHLGDAFAFDAGAFGISPREAAEMDPQQRILLEVALGAFEDAGWPPSSVAGEALGVFVGGSATDYADLRLPDHAGSDRYFMTGNALSILANRLTNVFDLRGPAETIDTACSSSLVALHAACRAVAEGRVPAALAAGVQMLLSPYPFVGFSRAGMLSPTGRCRAFDADADGYVRAEGAGAVILKRLDRALADGDAVRGVILASGVNSAGRTIGLSLPNRDAQARLIRQVMAEAGIGPDRLAYFEAHGTGTQAGDPAEAWAIGTAAASGRAAPLPIGSSKTNIGHLEPASGIAGLLKAMLVLDRRLVPPTLHQGRPNPRIDFGALNIRIPTQAEKLAALGAPVAGVNSFGFGGTNACVLLAPPPPARKAASARVGAAPPLLLSAHSAAALAALAARWRDRLAGTSPAEALVLARGAARHRDLLPHRLAVRGTDGAALAASLTGPARTEGVAVQGAVCFVFSGNGAQHAGMARTALRASPPFRRAMAEVDAALAPLLGWSPLARLKAGITAEELAATDIAQPLLFAIQVAMLPALAAEGVRPDMVLGHSVGEVAAAHSAGLLGLDAASRLVVARSRHQHACRGLGRMAALNATPEDAAALIAGAGPLAAGVEIAAFNAPAAVTLAGPAEGLDAVRLAAEARRLAFLPLDLDYAFHSAAMDPVRDALLADLAGLPQASPAVPMLSSVTGNGLAAGEVDATYWWRNLREPVRFEAAQRAALSRGARLFLEIGPNPILQSYLRETARAALVEAASLATLSKRDTEGADPFAAAADRAFVAGLDPRAGPAFAGVALRRLPLTPFDRRRHIHAATVEAARLTDPVEDHPLLGFRRGPEPGLWTRVLDTALEPWLADHRLGADAVLPAAAMLEIALAAGRARHPEAAALEVAELRILRPMTLEQDRSRELRATLDPEGAFRLESRQRLSEEGWTLHALGEVRPVPASALAVPSLPAARGSVVPGEAIRDRAAALGLTYRAAFAAVRDVMADPAAGTAEVRLALPESAPPDAAFILHPTRLDGALQGLFALLDTAALPPGTGLVPVKVGRLIAFADGALAAVADLVLTRRGTRSAAARILLRDAAGRVVASLDDVVFQRIALQGAADPTEAAARIELLPAAEGPPPPIALQPALDAARDAASLRALGEAALLLEAHVAAVAQGVKLLAAAPEAAAYLAFLRRALVEDGVAEATSGGFRLLPDHALPPADEIWRSVLAEHPDLALDLAWIAEAAEGVPDALRGLRRPVAPPLAGAAFAGLAEALAAAVAALAAAWPEVRPLTILEIGAGSDLLARRVAAALAPLGRSIRYVAAGEARIPLGDPPPGMTLEAAIWDPRAGVSPPVVADLVIGLAPAARQRAGATLAAALRPALAQGGALLLAEPLPGRVWSFVCGQDPTWWTGLGANPADGGALPDATLWLNRLEEAGFRATAAEKLPCAPWPAILLAAEAAPPPAAARPAPPRHMLVHDAPSAPFAEALAARLARAGAAVECLKLGEAPAPRRLAGARVAALARPDGDALPATLAALVRLSEVATGSAAGLVLVTAGGAQPAEGHHLPDGAALLGLMRVLANEMPALAPRRIDIAPDLSPDAAARRLVAELDAPPGAGVPEPEVTLAPAGRLVPRLVRGLAAPVLAGPLQLGIAQPGRLGTLRWEPAETRKPGPGEVALRIEAAGLNFRDLMWAQGLLPEDVLDAGFAGPTLGMECAGVVEEAGPGVALRPGARVFGVAPAALAARAVTRVEALAVLPDGLGFDAAATIPVAFMTALYALEDCARLQAGETVLIHGGAGAVGLAALQVAQAVGARVAMTAGSTAKRAFLRAAGADLVLDSRDPGFADALRRHWPDGVDVVLNSLAGEAMERSLGLVRPFGRFVELGKRDFVENRRAPLRPLRRNATYFAVDVDELPRARPALAARLLGRIRDGVQDGSFRPLPFAVFAPGDAEAAFRTLQASTHIGKLVVRPPSPRAAEPLRPWLPPKDSVVVVTGGTRGFGLACAKWLARQGVRHLALIGRRGAEDDALALRDLAALGAQAAIHACDAADAAALEATLTKIRAARPIGGVVHAAGVLDDAAALSLDAARFRRVLAPKLDAARHLDRLTAGDALSLFLLFGSATSVFGNPGQANYVAANAALDALSRQRRAAGRPALTVAWGPIADVGMLAADAAKAETLHRRLGVAAMRAEDALAALPALLAAPHAAPLLVRLTGGEGRLRLPLMAEPMLAALAGAESAPETGDLRLRLATLPREEAEAALLRLVQEEVGRILRLPPDAVAADAPVAGLGLDSLGALELRGALEARLARDVAIAGLSDTLTVAALARQIAGAVLAPAGGEATIAVLLDSFEAAPGPGALRAAE